jgi:hypothetical protein
MNAATAALFHAGIGIFGNLALTWINRHFDEKKTRRELIIRTAWDHFSTMGEWSKDRGFGLAPFETYLFHTNEGHRIGLNKDLSNEQIVEEVRKIRELSKAILADLDKEKAAKSVGR